MRPSKPPGSRIPATGGGSSSGPVGSRTGSTTPRGGSGAGGLSQSMVLSPSSVSSGSRLPLTPSPAPPKFQPFKRAPSPSPASTPASAAAGVSALPQLPSTTSATAGAAAPTAPTAATVDGGPVGNAAAVAGAAAGAQTPGQDAALLLSLLPPGQEQRQGPPGVEADAAKPGGAGGSGTEPAAAASTPQQQAAGTGPAVGAAAPDGPLQPVLPEALPLQGRLEALLREASGLQGGAGGASTPELQALARAILAACKAESAPDAGGGGAAVAAAGRSRRPYGASGVAAACAAAAVCLLALAACMSWVVWVLVDRQVIGPAAFVAGGGGEAMAREAFFE